MDLLMDIPMNLPKEMFLEIIESSSIEDILNLMSVDKNFNIFFNENKEMIYKNLLERDFCIYSENDLNNAFELAEHFIRDDDEIIPLGTTNENIYKYFYKFKDYLIFSNCIKCESKQKSVNNIRKSLYLMSGNINDKRIRIIVVINLFKHLDKCINYYTTHLSFLKSIKSKLIELKLEIRNDDGISDYFKNDYMEIYNKLYPKILYYISKFDVPNAVSERENRLEYQKNHRTDLVDELNFKTRTETGSIADRVAYRRRYSGRSGKRFGKRSGKRSGKRFSKVKKMKKTKKGTRKSRNLGNKKSKRAKRNLVKDLVKKEQKDQKEIFWNLSKNI